MRIGIDARVLQGEMRGQGQYVYYLVKNLLDIDKDNQYILFYNAFKKANFAFSESLPNLKQVWCRVPGRILRFSWSNLNFPPIEYLIGKVDIFHNPFNFNFTHYTPAPAKARMVVTFNGAGDPAKMWEKYDISRVNRWYKIIEKRADAVIAISGNAKDDFLRKAAIQENKVRVIYYGISDDFRLMQDKTENEARLAKYGLSGKRYILYVGAAEKNKNLSGLLEAFNKIYNKAGLEDVFLVMAGKIDSAYQKIIQQANESGVAKRTIFTDFISHIDLPFIYNSAELLVLPSFYEGFGIPLIEAMACGIPIAASRCGGMSEIAGDTALFFEPHDTDEISRVLFNILQDKNLREKLKKNGIIRAKDFTWKKTAEETLKVYKEVYNNI